MVLFELMFFVTLLLEIVLSKLFSFVSLVLLFVEFLLFVTTLLLLIAELGFKLLETELSFLSFNYVAQ